MCAFVLEKKISVQEVKKTVETAQVRSDSRGKRVSQVERDERVRFSNDRRNKSFPVPGGRTYERPGVKRQQCFTSNQLEILEQKGMPQPLSQAKLVEITDRIYNRHHEENVTCCVCNQFVRIGTARSLTVSNLPLKFFDLLQAPDGSPESAPRLHPKLVQQYNVSQFFPGDDRFRSVLLSPGGILTLKLLYAKMKNNIPAFRIYTYATTLVCELVLTL